MQRRGKLRQNSYQAVLGRMLERLAAWDLLQRPAVFGLLLAVVGWAVVSLGVQPAAGSSDYFPLDQTMAACGFQGRRSGQVYSYSKTVAGQEIIITYDFAVNQGVKNEYIFDLTGQWAACDNVPYLAEATLESITNYDVAMTEQGVVAAQPIAYAPHAWTTDHPALVAHAGGIFRHSQGDKTLTNGLATVIQNYNMGHRVFELDFQLTTDQGLAAVHEGMVPGGAGGIALTRAQWLQYVGLGNIRPMLIGDVLDQMLINGDMFVITDTKAKDGKAFAIIYEEAKKRDIALLDRIVPQIYQQSMYDDLMDIYPFPSVIFTVYQTGEKPGDILAFCAAKDNIAVLTVPMERKWDLRTYLAGAKDSGVKIYTHTVNGFSEMAGQLAMGVHGVYTDYLLPADLAYYYDTNSK